MTHHSRVESREATGARGLEDPAQVAWVTETRARIQKPASASRLAVDLVWPLRLAALLVGLSLGAVPAAAQDCVTTGGCTGDVSGAGMCGISTEPIETGQGCGFVNNCQEPKILSGPELEIEVVPVRRRQNPLFKVRLVATVETPWNIWARTNNVNGSIQALWTEKIPADVPFFRFSLCHSLLADQHKVTMEKTMTCAQMRATRDKGGTNTSILKYDLGLGACGPPCDPNDASTNRECPTHPCHKWKVEKDIPLSIPDKLLDMHCPLKEDPCTDQQDPADAGPGAFLRYTRGGIGGDAPGSAAWNAELGRYWSHDYAERVVEDPDNPDHVFLVIADAIYREFWDYEGDGIFDQVSPTDAVFGLTRDGGGYLITDFDGTTRRFDGGGRWLETADRDGNAIRGIYTSGRLSEVAFPDGRTERFAYGADGKLASITEVGVDGATTRQWRYFWSGLDLERIEKPDGTATLLHYDDPANPGYLTRRTARGTDGSERIEQAWSYDAYGNIVKTWKGASTPQQGVEVTTYSYPNPWNFTERRTVNALGEETTVTYRRDADSNVALVTSITGSCPTCSGDPNSARSYGDSNHPTRITRIEDGVGNVTLMSYDSKGQLSSRTEAAGTPFERTTRWQYDPDFPGLAVSKEVPSTSGAGVRRVAWDRVGGRVLTETRTGIENGSAFTLTTAMTYNPAGQIENVDPPGFGAQDVTSLTYHADRGNLMLESRTAPGRGTTTFEYDPFNRLSRLTDANGVVTETTYDALDRPLTEIVLGSTSAQDLVTRFTYTPFGDLHRIVLPRGNVVERDYDAFGRWVSTERKPDTTTAGERKLWILDDAGRRIREELQSWTGTGWQTESARDFVFSSGCQLEKIVYADGTVEEFAYDCAGRLAEEWDANHSRAAGDPASRSYAYDALGRIGSVTVPWGGSGGGQVVSSYGYDPQDNLARVVDASGTVTRYVYGDRNLLTSRESEVSGVTQRFYDEHGALVREVDGRQVEVRFELDAAGRVTRADYSDDRLDVTYTYDDPATPFSIGRLSSLSRGDETISYAYDRLGRPTRDGDLVWTYDPNGNPETLTYPGDVVATYGYDFADRALSLSLRDGAAAARPVADAASYEPFGPLSGLTLGNGLREDRPVDSRYRTVGIRVGTALDWSLTRDGVANVTAITDHLEPAASRAFGYQDHQYFLRDASGPWGSVTWAYDASGNRTSETRGLRVLDHDYATNAAGKSALHLESITAEGPDQSDRRYLHDAAGNLTHVLAGGDKTLYSYDAAGRIARLRRDRAGVPMVTDFSYDGRGFLASSLRMLPAAEWRTSVIYGSEGRLYQRSVDRPLHPASARDDSDRASDDYVLYFADRPVAVYSRRTISRPGVPPENRTALAFLTTDAVGTPVLITGESGEVAWKGVFEPFGSGFDAAGSGPFLRLSGQWSDASWDAGDDALFENVHRWYDPSIGRYLKPDPMEFFLQDGASAPMPYLYAGNNPLRDSDPLGLYTAVGSPGFKDRVDDAMQRIRDAIRKKKRECCTQYFADRGVNLGADLESGGKPFVRQATGAKLKALKAAGACGTASTSSPFIHVWVNPDCFKMTDFCGFASNILHEMGHLARRDTTDNEPSDFFQACNLGCVNAGAYR